MTAVPLCSKPALVLLHRILVEGGESGAQRHKARFSFLALQFQTLKARLFFIEFRFDQRSFGRCGGRVARRRGRRQLSHRR